MYAYRIALFLHLFALMLATGATAVTKLAATRRARARTVGEALDWHNVLTGASKLFPIALAIFVLTGGYMLSMSHLRVWSTGFVVAGLVGVVLLFASGAFLGVQGNAAKAMLEQLAKDGSDRPAPRMTPPRLVAILPLVNTGLAVSVAYVMVTKPASVPVALGIVLGVVALSVVAALRQTAAGAAGQLPRSNESRAA
jgi:hypothetical protein